MAKELPPLTAKTHVYKFNPKSKKQELVSHNPRRIYMCVDKPDIYEQPYGSFRYANGEVISDAELVKLDFDKEKRVYSPSSDVLKGIEEAKREAGRRFGYRMAQSTMGIK